MKKEHLITASYLLVSVGLFVLAIEMWICGAEPYCRNGETTFASRIAKAAISITVPEYYTTGWSGPSEPDFSVTISGGTTVQSLPGDSDGH